MRALAMISALLAFGLASCGPDYEDNAAQTPVVDNGVEANGTYPCEADASGPACRQAQAGDACSESADKDKCVANYLANEPAPKPQPPTA